VIDKYDVGQLEQCIVVGTIKPLFQARYIGQALTGQTKDVYEPGMSFLERRMGTLDVRARISRATLPASAARLSLLRTGV
jgi:hypothetical protein